MRVAHPLSVLHRWLLTALINAMCKVNGADGAACLRGGGRGEQSSAGVQGMWVSTKAAAGGSPCLPPHALVSGPRLLKLLLLTQYLYLATH